MRKFILLTLALAIFMGLSACTKTTNSSSNQASTKLSNNNMSPSTGVYLPMQRDKQPVPALLTWGTLILEKGYFRLGKINSTESDLLIWPQDYAVRQVNGITQVMSPDGKFVASAGDKLKMGGGNVTWPEVNNYLDDKLPDSSLSPFWLVSSAEVVTSFPSPSIPVTSQNQAAKIAKENMPSKIIPLISLIGADLDLTKGQWFVDITFFNTKITKEDLQGGNFQMDSADTFNLLIIRIEKQTGKIVSKIATNGQVTGHPGFWINSDP